MSWSTSLIAPRSLGHGVSCGVCVGWPQLARAGLLLALLIYIARVDLPARHFSCIPSRQYSEHPGETLFCLTHHLVLRVSQKHRGWNQPSVSVELTSPQLSLLHHWSHCKTGQNSRDTSSPSPADLELLSKAMLPLATSITAAFWRLKLITIRNCLMTRSCKVCGFYYYCDPSMNWATVQPNERYGLDSKCSCCLFIRQTVYSFNWF